MTAILEKTKELGELIVKSDEFQLYAALKDEKDNDEVLNELIKSYNLTRLSLSNEINGGADKEQTEELQKALTQKQEEIMKNDLYKRFSDSEDVFKNLIAQINTILAHFLDPDSENACGSGGCSGCSGCN